MCASLTICSEVRRSDLRYIWLIHWVAWRVSADRLGARTAFRPRPAASSLSTSSNVALEKQHMSSLLSELLFFATVSFFLFIYNNCIKFFGWKWENIPPGDLYHFLAIRYLNIILSNVVLATHSWVSWLLFLRIINVLCTVWTKLWHTLVVQW